MFEAGDDDEEEPWERSEQLLRIAASTRRDTRASSRALHRLMPQLTRHHAAVIKRALPSDAASASVLSAYAPEQGTPPRLPLRMPRTTALIRPAHAQASRR